MNPKQGMLIGMCMIAGSMLVSCSSSVRQTQNPPVPGTPGVSNGEQVYFTGADQNGNRIQYTGGPNFGGTMMGSYLTCAACHGPDAHGGEHVMHMQTMDAPAIYYAALLATKIEDSGGTPQPGGYSLTDFQKAVEGGEDTSGGTLSTDMPRWKMSDQDLADLFAFLQTIEK